MNQKDLPVALSIASSDSGAAAGIQADLLTFAARGVWGTTAIAALTAQNPRTVSAIHEVSPDFLRAQIQTVTAHYKINAAKTGMLCSAQLIKTTASELKRLRCPLVLDPVMISSSGARLLAEDAIAALTQCLFPLASLVTPNLDEVGALYGKRPARLEDMRAAGQALALKYRCAFLIKGGHLEGDELIDLLVLSSAEELLLKAQRKPNINTHGSGCTLSAAITAELAKGKSLTDAVKSAHQYLQAAINAPVRCQDENFIAHLR